MSRRYFRADKDDLLAEGESLIQSDRYPNRCNASTKRAEEFLRRYHPLGKARGTSIFIFEDEGETRNYYNHQKGRNLYELEVNDADIVHRADMNWINKIGDAIEARDEASAKTYADNWIKGIPTDKPRWETLTKAAKVKSIFGTAADSPANKTPLQRAIEKNKDKYCDKEYPFLDPKPE